MTKIKRLLGLGLILAALIVAQAAFSSLPLPVTQPDAKNYTVYPALDMFREWTYNSYLDTYGAAPPWDSTKFGGRVKNWADTSDPSRPVVGYVVPGFDSTGHPGFFPFAMTGADAALLNIPPHWPPQNWWQYPIGTNDPASMPVPTRVFLPNETWSPWTGLVGLVVMRTDK